MIETSYGDNLHGKKVVIVYKKFGGIRGILAAQETPKHLIGKIGIVTDDIYDADYTDYPTGYERRSVEVTTKNGEVFWVDSVCVRVVR